MKFRILKEDINGALSVIFEQEVTEDEYVTFNDQLFMEETEKLIFELEDAGDYAILDDSLTVVRRPWR